MDDNPVVSPRSSQHGVDGVLHAAPLADAPPPPPADAAAVAAAVAPAAPPPPALPAPVHPAPAPSVPSSILQTVDIRRHVPVTLDLLAGNYTQWRRHFNTIVGMFGLRDHVDSAAVHHHGDPEWDMADHVVVHWLYITISPELLDVVMQPDDTALTVWAAVDGIFRDNQLARAIYLDAEYHAVVQGDMTVMAYCTKLKQFTDQLPDLG
ncbi:unnamed protein product [Triticum aestivum]|uniref:Uncharacterized protein n=1 Tax=Triticum aestivum TaxID=4565 RepID=A0A7H4LDL9_WHEAT|nr:unnamed protein product [Triticum aestivum]